MNPSYLGKSSIVIGKSSIVIAKVLIHDAQMGKRIRPVYQRGYFSFTITGLYDVNQHDASQRMKSGLRNVMDV